MEFETTTTTSKSGVAKDPEGPSKLVITWDSTIRIEVLPAGPAAPNGIRLRTTYEKSSASAHSDTFDPAAAETQGEYEKLQGKVLEFSLDGAGNVKSVSGLEGVVNSEAALKAASDWIARLDASSGAPAGGVVIGQKWQSDMDAKELPVAGLVWRTESEYLRNEACHPPNPEVPESAIANASGNSDGNDTCAVILAQLSLVRPKPVRNSTPEDYRKNGVQTAGTWNGSAESLSYISLKSGVVVSVTQTGTQNMDVTLTTTNLRTSMHYSGSILSRSQVALISGEVAGK